MPLPGPALPWKSSLEVLQQPRRPIAWIMDPLFPAGAVVLVSGREGSMKSWLALHWAHAVAGGTPWAGHQTQAGQVLYLDAEMPPDLFHDRLQALGGSANLNVWHWSDAQFPARLNDALLKQAAASHQLIIIDTLRRFMPNLNENSADDMAQVTRWMRQLTTSGATVLALHHALKDSERTGYRGSTELGAGVDIVMFIMKHEKGDQLIVDLTTPKTRYGQAPRLKLSVQVGAHAPIFEMASGEMPSPGNSATFEALRHVIADLVERLGRHPNQSDIVREARARGLGSRETIRKWLDKGQGAYWHFETSNGPLKYTPLPLSTCLPVYPLEGDVVRQTRGQNPLRYLSNHGGIGNSQLDRQTRLSPGGQEDDEAVEDVA
jgi:hypothetical protein